MDKRNQSIEELYQELSHMVENGKSAGQLEAVSAEIADNLGLHCTHETVKELLEKGCEKHLLVLCCNQWKLGGIERVMIQLMRHFTSQYKIMIISHTPDEKHYEIPDEVVHVEIDQDGCLPEAYRIALFVKLIQASIYIGNANLSEEFLDVYKLLNELQTKSIMLNHYSWLYPYKWEAFLSRAIKKRNEIMIYPDIVLTLTENSAFLCSESTGRKVGVIPNSNTFRDVEYVEEQDREDIILAVGRFDDPVKRIDRTLEIFSKMCETNNNAKLYVVGKTDDDLFFEGGGPTFKEILHNLNLPEQRVFFVGESCEVQKYYRKAKVVIFTSEGEGFGMVLTEAGNFGIPVVANYFPGIEDVIVEGQNGFLLDERDTDGMAEKLQELLVNQELWKERSLNAVKLVERFSEQNVTDKWEAIFAAVQNNDNRGQMEKDLETGQIIRSNELDKSVLKECIKEYEESISKMMVRFCRCDDLINLLEAQRISLSTEATELREQLHIANQRGKESLFQKIKRKLFQ